MPQSKYIYVVDDDLALASDVSGELVSRGYAVRTTHLPEEAVEAARNGEAEAIVIDRMLGDIDGLTLVEQMREAGIRTPVLVISGMATVDDRIEGLRAGGDDYLTKPFELRELGARVDCLTRRLADLNATMLQVGDVSMDLINRTVRRSDRAIDLQPREFKLLEFFLRRPNQIVTRTMLLKQVWNYSLQTQTNVVDMHIGQLRRKIESAGQSRIIVNVRGEGFMLHVAA